MDELTPAAANGAAPPTDLDVPAVAPPDRGDQATSGEGGAAPSATPYQRRRQREAERKRTAAERRAKREAKAATKGTEAAKAAEPAQAADDDRDDAQRAHETGGAWRLVLRLVSLVMWPFGYRLEPLTDKECAEDVRLLVPLARRHLWLDLCVRYAALPYLLVERIVAKTRRRDTETDAKEPPK